MGAWGAGLYANDAALDMKGLIATIMRLPLDVDSMVELLVETEPSLGDPASENHTGCWFVVADRFHRYGIDHEPIVARVREYVTSGKDLRMMAELGMSDSDLRSRSKVLDALLSRITAPNPKPSRRRILAKPQPLLFLAGDLLSFPMQDGQTGNPYFSSWEEARFRPNGFGAALILEAGRSFEYLAWYRLSMLGASWSNPPSLDDCLEPELAWSAYGTLSPTHRKRLAIEQIARVEIGPGVLRLHEPHSREIPEDATILDYRISSRMALPDTRGTAAWKKLSGVRLGEVISG